MQMQIMQIIGTSSSHYQITAKCARELAQKKNARNKILYKM